MLNSSILIRRYLQTYIQDLRKRALGLNCLIYAIDKFEICNHYVCFGTCEVSKFYPHLSRATLMLQWLLMRIISCAVVLTSHACPSQWSGIRSAESSMRAMVCRVQIGYDIWTYVRNRSTYWQISYPWFIQSKETGSVEKQKSRGRPWTSKELVERVRLHV